MFKIFRVFMENFEKILSQNVDSLFLSPLPFSLLSLSLALPSPLCARQSTRRCRPLAAPLHARARCPAAAPLLPRCAAPSQPHSSAHAALAAPPAHATLGDDRDRPSAAAAARPARAARPAPRPTCPALSSSCSPIKAEASFCSRAREPQPPPLTPPSSPSTLSPTLAPP